MRLAALAALTYRRYLQALGYTDDEVFRIEQLRDGSDVPMSEVCLTRDLTEALAAEEHRQGMAYGDDADHCGDCATEAVRRNQAESEHQEASTVEMTALDQPRQELLRTCRDCGLSWREEGEWL